MAISMPKVGASKTNLWQKTTNLLHSPLGKLQLQFQYQRTVVGGGPELAHAGFPVGGKAVPDHAEGLDAGHHRRGAVQVVNPSMISGSGKGKRVQPFPLDVGEVGKPCQIILREEFRGTLQ